jgi:hypothetical protein
MVDKNKIKYEKSRSTWNKNTGQKLVDIFEKQLVKIRLL